MQSIGIRPANPLYYYCATPYVRGQLSDLLRKSIEPIALEAGVPPRTLQFFFSSGRFRVKDGESGPRVWEVKVGRFYRKHGPDGLPGPTHTLIVARNVLEPDELKYFLSNGVAGRDGLTLEWLLWAAFSRFPVERCFELGKRDLGLDHFEMRTWRGIHRHLYVSQLSLLFCARVHQRLREKNDRFALPDRRAGARGRLRLAGGPELPAPQSSGGLSEGGRPDRLLPAPQPRGPQGSPQGRPAAAAPVGHQTQLPQPLCAS